MLWRHHTWYAFFYPAINFVFSSVNAKVNPPPPNFFLLRRDYLICLLQSEVQKKTPCGYNYIICRRTKKKYRNNESPFFWIGLVFLDDNLEATVLDSGDHSFLKAQKKDNCYVLFCFIIFFIFYIFFGGGFFDLSHWPVYTNRFLGQQWILMSASVSVKFVCSWICQLTLLIEFCFVGFHLHYFVDGA